MTAAAQLPTDAERASWANPKDAALLSAFGHDVVASLSLFGQYDIKAVAHAAGYIADAWLIEHSTELVTAEWLERRIGPEATEPVTVHETGRWWREPENGRLYITERDLDHRVDNRTVAETEGLLRWLNVPLKGMS